MDPLISVIIPVYNVRPYLQEALDSVVKQTYYNLEIILIDDGSIDGSYEFCDDFARKDERVYLIHQENRGLSGARNAGINKAKGEIIAFLDPDDAYNIQMIELLVEEMMEHQSDIVICGFSVQKTQLAMHNQTFENVKFRRIGKREALQGIIKGKINTAPWNKIYKRKIWEGIRFPEGQVYEGTYCIFDIFDKVERISLTNAELVMHRNRPGSICNTRDDIYLRDYDLARRKYYTYVRDHTPDFFL